MPWKGSTPTFFKVDRTRATRRPHCVGDLISLRSGQGISALTVLVPAFHSVPGAQLEWLHGASKARHNRSTARGRTVGTSTLSSRRQCSTRVHFFNWVAYLSGIIRPRLAPGLVGSFRHPWRHRSIAPTGRRDESQHELSDTLQHQPSRGRARLGAPGSTSPKTLFACYGLPRLQAPGFFSKLLAPASGHCCGQPHLLLFGLIAASRALRQFACFLFLVHFLTEPFPPCWGVRRATLSRISSVPRRRISLWTLVPLWWAISLLTLSATSWPFFFLTA